MNAIVSIHCMTGETPSKSFPGTFSPAKLSRPRTMFQTPPPNTHSKELAASLREKILFLSSSQAFCS